MSGNALTAKHIESAAHNASDPAKNELRKSTVTDLNPPSIGFASPA